MAKTKISEFSSTPANNTDINGINIAEGCAPSGINNAIRQLMADLKDFQAGTAGDPLTVGGALTVTGTTALSGAATAPTPATSDSSTNIATTAYVTNKIAASTSGLSDPGGSGIVARTATAGATVARTITAGTGISVSNGSGVSGNPTITNSGVTSFNGSTGAVTGVSSVNGSTGAVTLPFSKSYTSPQYSTFSGTQTSAHGLGAMPVLTQLILVCTSATQGYSVGDQVFVPAQDDPGYGSASIAADATNLSLIMPSSAGIFRICNKSTGSAFTPTSANFNIFVRAWA